MQALFNIHCPTSCTNDKLRTMVSKIPKKTSSYLAIFFYLNRTCSRTTSSHTTTFILRWKRSFEDRMIIVQIVVYNVIVSVISVVFFFIIVVRRINIVKEVINMWVRKFIIISVYCTRRFRWVMVWTVIAMLLSLSLTLQIYLTVSLYW